MEYVINPITKRVIKKSTLRQSREPTPRQSREPTPRQSQEPPNEVCVNAVVLAQCEKMTFAERIANEHEKVLNVLINKGLIDKAKELLSILINSAINDPNY